ncbi:histone-lysine N-methyltransferase ASHH2 [Gastrolobium bilobum]|uniref:histone-lysine N-methyltransferase ASHH2 n=1 Tax=Gastrolobium bilobum TaxID=150636 RepID=UPI002AB20B56|nr:histone-lysine N-methyltransferase ASHH2 [Gastrolobium bilobum]XP_061373325.1 histone-lysine N-methyltransferase ASHH2 [Gastrolobium bilobum]XP_061373326.1 histone-lysine N-methyltransferase ASHH2 [Gastrolobium bilobum]
MGSCGKSAIVDDPSGGSVIEQHLCSEFPVQSVPVQQSGIEEACNVLDSNVDLSSMTEASFVDVTEGSRDALASECENADMFLLEKTAEDDCQNCLGICGGNIEVSCLQSGGLCSGGKFHDQGSLDVPSETVPTNKLEKHCAQQGEQKDDKSNILPSAGDDSAVVEGKNDDAGLLADAFNCVFGFRHSEVSLESDSMTDLVVDCNQQSEQEEIMRNADPLPKVVEKCDALSGMEIDACRQISPSPGMEVPLGALYTDTEVESTSGELHDQKDGEDWNSTCEEKIKAFVDKEISMNSFVKVLSSPGCHRTLGSSPVVDSPCEPTLLDSGSEVKNGILQIEDNICRLKDSSSEETTNSNFSKPLYPESDQPTFVLITNSSLTDMSDLLCKDDDVPINNNSAVDNPGWIDNDGKRAVEIDCVTESLLLPSQRNSRRTRFGSKTQTKKTSRKCKNKDSVAHPGVVMKINFRKKRSCFSKPARSSVWGLLGNIKQSFEQDNELGVSESMCQEVGKTRNKRQSGKAIKNGASSSSSSSAQKCSVSTTRYRLKIKFGKETDLRCSNVLIPEASDGLASASCLGSGSGSQKVASNAEDKFSEVVALGNLESFKNDLDKDGLVLNGQIANSHLENTGLMKNPDGDAEEQCLAVPTERVVEALIDPINNKSMDPGTSPDSEVINSIPEGQVGERHQEDLHHAVLDLSKGFSSNLDVTISKRGKKKDKLICSSNCITEDGAQGPPGNNRAKNSKNRRCKKNCSDAVSSLELPTSTEISKSLSSEELSIESLPLSGEIELGGSTKALKVECHMEVKTTCKPSVDHGESQVFENLLSSARSLGRKLPKSLKPNSKSLKPSRVSKAKSKASDSSNRKKTTCRSKEKPKKQSNKSEVKGKGVSLKVTSEVEDHPVPANFVGNLELDAVGKINAGDNKVSVNVSNLDMLPAVGLGEQHLSPRNAWVRCDDCHKWRRIPAVLADQIDETNCTWTCKDSSDKSFDDCAISQEKSNAEINKELGLSDASGEEDAYEDSKAYKELEYQLPLVSQESTFTHIFTNEFLHRNHKTQTIDEIMVCHCKPSQHGKLGCGDECLNRMLNIECVQGTCPCGDHCSNQQFQKRNYASLKWFKCGKKGYGLKTLDSVAKGQFLIEYVGEVLDMHAYEARQREYALKGHRHFYFMTLNGSEVIDASAKGNLGRFINHSCDPNCRTEKWMVNGEICIGLFALRDIKQDEELTFDYNYVRVFGAAAKKCYCGSPHCRGYIGGGDPLNAELIVQGDSDEEFPEPVMLIEDGEIEDSVPIPKYYDNVDTQSARHILKGRDVLAKSKTAIDADGSTEKESSVNPASAVSLLQSSVEVDSKDKLPSSIRAERISQQMEDVTSKPVSALQGGYSMESEFVDKTSSVQRLDTTPPLTTVSKVLSNSTGSSNRESKSETVEGMNYFSQSHLLVKTPQQNGSVKKGKVRANPPNGLKPEVTANRMQLSSIKHKKVVEGSSNGRFEAVQEKLNELLDGDGGISKRKDATKGYLKLLLLTVASGDRINGEAIQSNRDLSMILDALLKTKSRAVLNDIINKNGLQMLHNIMKQYRQDFKKIPILRKLLKVLEYLATSKILTSEHISGGPPCQGMESFRESMLSLTEHDDKQVHQIARNFRDRWIPRPVRKHGYMDRDDSRVEYHRSFNSNRFSASHNHRHDQDSRPTEAIDSGQQSMLVTTSVDAGAQEGCSAPSLAGAEIKGAKKRKRKSRWDQPAETNSHSDAVISSINESQNIHEDVPPGFSFPIGSLNASLNSGDLAFQNATHSGCPSDVVIGHPKEKFNSRLPVSYGIPWSVAHQYGTPHAESTHCWVTAPGMPFNPFPPLPSYPRDDKDCQISNTTNAMTIDQPAEVKQWDTSGLVNCCSDDMILGATGANSEDINHPCEDNKHITKRLKEDSSDLGRRYFRQQKWNNSKIHRPWFRRNGWQSNGNNTSGGDVCSMDVDVPKESKVICSSEDAICRDEKAFFSFLYTVPGVSCCSEY